MELDIGRYLMAHHIRPSYQRVRVYQYLYERRSHPTIDEIYAALVPEIPTLSKTTVYNTLDLFIREKIAQPITIEKNKLRYDADTSVHGHFLCAQCGKVYDFTVDSLSVQGLDGFYVQTESVFYEGICPDCHRLLSVGSGLH